MISVLQAENIIKKNLSLFPAESKPLTQCYGLVLRESIKADRDLPAFDQCRMDGIAVSYAALQKGRREFKLEGTQRPGEPKKKLKSSDGYFEIMTGSAIPIGCDNVIPIEQIHVNHGIALVNEGKRQRFDCIRRQGTNQNKGDLLLSAGHILNPVAVGIAASAGKAKLRVSIKPKVAIIATGDELVDITHQNIKPFQVRLSNSYFLNAALQSSGLFESMLFHFRDDEELLRREISRILQKFDVIISSGGVSMGKFDFLPKIFAELKVKVKFHKVAQRPGKPFWFGMTPKKQPVFALPGNPVSTQVCFYRFVLPSLRRALGLNIEESYVNVRNSLVPHREMMLYQPVRLTAPGQAEGISYHDSGDFAALAGSNGFIEIPSGNKQKIFRYFSW